MDWIQLLLMHKCFCWRNNIYEQISYYTGSRFFQESAWCSRKDGIQRLNPYNKYTNWEKMNSNKNK